MVFLRPVTIALYIPGINSIADRETQMMGYIVLLVGNMALQPYLRKRSFSMSFALALITFISAVLLLPLCWREGYMNYYQMTFNIVGIGGQMAVQMIEADKEYR